MPDIFDAFIKTHKHRPDNAARHAEDLETESTKELEVTLDEPTHIVSFLTKRQPDGLFVPHAWRPFMEETERNAFLRTLVNIGYLMLLDTGDGFLYASACSLGGVSQANPGRLGKLIGNISAIFRGSGAGSSATAAQGVNNNPPANSASATVPAIAAAATAAVANNLPSRCINGACDSAEFQYSLMSDDWRRSNTDFTLKHPYPLQYTPMFGAIKQALGAEKQVQNLEFIVRMEMLCCNHINEVCFEVKAMEVTVKQPEEKPENLWIALEQIKTSISIDDYKISKVASSQSKPVSWDGEIATYDYWVKRGTVLDNITEVTPSAGPSAASLGIKWDSAKRSYKLLEKDKYYHKMTMPPTSDVPFHGAAFVMKRDLFLTSYFNSEFGKIAFGADTTGAILVSGQEESNVAVPRHYVAKPLPPNRPLQTLVVTVQVEADIRYQAIKPKTPADIYNNVVMLPKLKSRRIKFPVLQFSVLL